MNQVVLVGRLTKEPELRYTPNGKPVATFILAVNRPFKNQYGEYEVDFIPVVVWNKQAENAANYLSKGSLAGVDGRIQVRSYEGQNGRRYVTEVLAESVQFLESKGNGHRNENKPNTQPQKQNDDPFSGSSMDIDDSDLPF